MTRHYRSMVLSLLVLVAGCTADTSAPDDLMPGVNPDAPVGARLELVGPALRSVDESAEDMIQVRYVDEFGAPIAGVVDFRIEGTSPGASLSGTASPTNDDGVAGIVLRAGTEARFDVVASAPLAAVPAIVHFNVQRLRFGALEYAITYAGRRDVGRVETALFPNLHCDDLARAVPSPMGSQNTRLNRTERYENVETGLPVALYALGIDGRDNVAAEACADVTVDSLLTRVDLQLADTQNLFGGDYDVSETFDVTAGFSPQLDLLLDLATGLSTDPARWIVDYVAADPGTPDWLAFALSFGPTRDAVVTSLRGAIGSIHVPGYVSEVASFGHGVDLAFTNLTFDGRLRFSEPNEFGTAAGTHRLSRITFPLTSGGVAERALPDTTVADVTVTVSPTIQLAAHSFNLAFGDVVQMVLNDVLLPRLPGAPHSMAELFRQLFDCSSIATALGGGDPTMVAVANGVCEIGVTLLGGVADSYVTSLWQYDTLTLSGTADVVDSDLDYDADLLRNGTAQAAWTGSSGELDFTGVFAGHRTDDTAGRPNAVRTRLYELR